MELLQCQNDFLGFNRLRIKSILTIFVILEPLETVS